MLARICVANRAWLLFPVCLIALLLVTALAPSGTAQVPVDPGHYEEDDPALTFRGGWPRYHNGNASGGTWAASDETQARVTFSFAGSQVIWYTITGPDRGIARVRIDRRDWQEVDNYSSIVRWQIARVFGNLGRGVHFLTIEVTGWKNAASSHHFVDIDALEVINAPEATCIPEPQTIIAVGGEPHGLTLDAGANRLYVANYADDTISIIDTSSNSVVDTLTDAGGTPNGVAYDPINDRLYVTNRMSNTVTVIDLASRQVLGTITVGDRPEGIAFNPVTADIYVANFGSNTVSIIYDTAVVATLQVGSEPSQIAVNPAMNRIYVTNHGDHSASVIDGTARMVIGTIGGLAMAPYGIAVDPALNRVYVADIDGARLELIDATTNRRLDALIAPANAALRMVGVNADTHFVYATQDEDDSYPTRWQLENVFIYAYKPDKGRLESTRGFAIGNDPEAGLAIDSGRNRVYVANRMDNTVAVLACPEMPGEGTSTPTATVSPTPMPSMTPAITPIGGNP